MTGLISGIKRNAVHDGDGLRTTVFFKGCPLKCIWCHNPEGIGFRPEVGFYQNKCIGCGSCAALCPEKAISICNGVPVTDRSRCVGCLSCAEFCPGDAREAYGRAWELEPLVEKLLEDKTFFDNSGGGVTLSGGECLAQPTFVVALAKQLHSHGVSVDIDTCGAVKQQIFADILPYTDTFLYDLKAIDPDVHKHCTGKDNGMILDNLKYLCQAGARIEIRYPYVPGWNDGECSKIGQFLSGLPGITKVKVLGYHNFADGKYDALSLPNTLPDVVVTPSDVQPAVDTLKSFGLNAVNGMVSD